MGEEAGVADMSQQQQQQEEHEAVLCDALARVAVGLGGIREAQLFATELRLGTTKDHARKETDESLSSNI